MAGLEETKLVTKLATIRAACTQPEKDWHSGLLTLDLNYQSIGAAGGALLGAALAAMPSPLPYEVMNLSCNNLTNAGIAPVAAAIGSGRAPHLKTVDVCENELGDEGAQALGAALATCPEIKTVVVNDNGLGDEGRTSLQVALGPRAWVYPGTLSWIIDQPEWSTNAFWEGCSEGHGAHRILIMESFNVKFVLEDISAQDSR